MKLLAAVTSGKGMGYEESLSEKSKRPLQHLGLKMNMYSLFMFFGFVYLFGPHFGMWGLSSLTRD